MSVRSDLLIRYRRQTTDWLIAEDLRLYAMLTPFTAQSVGEKSYSQAPQILTEQLAAINQVLNEREVRGPRTMWGQVNFSNNREAGWGDE